jgi:ribosomal protein S12 methylthiotransferase
MIGLLDKEGLIITNNEYDADIIVINTCGFIESAKQESIDNILDAARRKEDSRCKLLVVTGCLAERYNKEILKEISEVDAVIGTGNFEEIVEVIKDALKGKKVLKYGNIDKNLGGDLLRIRSTPPYTAYLKIADGCNNSCTYCIIPKLRGKYRSRKEEDIISEAKKMAFEGVKEIILIAQDTTKYGHDLYHEYRLHKLLEKLCKIESIEWIRLQYMYPETLYNELIETISRHDNVLNYFDIPIQHCSNNILRRMGRHTSKDKIITLINKIRNKIPDSIIRTSLIVGFPGETDEEFNELCEFVKEVQFDRLGVFSYSQEEDTPAALFEDQVDEKVKVYRNNKLMKIQKNISKKINDNKINCTAKVLIEGFYEDKAMYYGRTYGDSLDVDSKIFIKSNEKIREGTFVNVRVKKAYYYDLEGEVL